MIQNLRLKGQAVDIEHAEVVLVGDALHAEPLLLPYAVQLLAHQSLVNLD